MKFSPFEARVEARELEEKICKKVRPDSSQVALNFLGGYDERLIIESIYRIKALNVEEYLVTIDECWETIDAMFSI